jgi:hypothetical protein
MGGMCNRSQYPIGVVPSKEFEEEILHHNYFQGINKYYQKLK